MLDEVLGQFDDYGLEPAQPLVFGKLTCSGSWENVPLQQIVRDVAIRNSWQPVCPVTTKVPRVDQLN